MLALRHMKYSRIITLLSAAGILLSVSPAAALSVPLPEIGAAVSPATKKKKQGKKGKTTKGKAKKENKTEALAKKIFNATDEQKQKAKALLEEQGHPDLKTAIEKDNDKAVVAHLICGASAQDALKLSITANKPKYVKICIAAPGIDVNKDEPLRRAASNGHVEIVRLLLQQKGVDINMAEKSYATPLSDAAYFGHTEIVKLLLKQPGIDVNKMAPLASAARRGQLECVKLLLNAPGINVNEVDLNDGATALSCAASREREEIFKLLLKMPGINVNTPDSSGGTPLGDAALYGTPEMVKLLINTQGFDASSWNPVSLAVLKDDIAELKALIQAKKDVNKTDARGMTPLHWAVVTDRIECLRILVKAPGINANIVEDVESYTALHMAAEKNKPECIKLLLTVPGIDPNITSGKQLTPLHRQVTPLYRALDHIECVKLLVADPRVDVNKAPTWGYSPLYNAASEGNIELVKLLLANPNIDVNAGETTPLQRATENGHTEIIKLLEEAGAK